MTKEQFYQGKYVVTVEWWLHTCDLPDCLTWARLRVFNDGTADSCFCKHCKLYGFENHDYARYFLSEDEYTCFNNMDEEDQEEYGIELVKIQPPTWQEYPNQLFEYLGTY